MPQSPLSPRTSHLYVWVCVFATLVGILAQFTLAGLALFVSESWWSAHIAVGASVALPLAALLISARRSSLFGQLARPVWWLAALYSVQVLLAAVEVSDTPVLRALHVGNAALVMAAALNLAQRVFASHTAR